MDIERISAFSKNGQGGNPAGVFIADELPSRQQMQSIAKDVGYSETAFAAPERDGFKVRYFAPSMEVAFCGHATIALGAALGRKYGAGRYELALSKSNISVDAIQQGDTWGAKLTSPETSQSPIPVGTLDEILNLFEWSQDDLGEIPPSFANAGAEHALIFLKNKSLLEQMHYEFDTGRALMERLKLVTINCLWREESALFHARNAFASGGVVEDPATGAAAAALAGYLRDTGRFSKPFSVIQGVDMGAPSRLEVEALPQIGAPILVAGQTRMIATT